MCSYLKFTPYRILIITQIFTWSIPSGHSANRNPSPMRKFRWGQEIGIKTDFIFIEALAMEHTLC